MSNTAAQHYYRFTYLKSEHWQNLRIAKLASVDARCAICALRELSNDVHHVIYRKLFDVVLEDLVVLCRACHKKVHIALDEFQFIKKIKDVKARWKKTINRVKYGKEIPEECKTGWLSAVNAKRLYREAALMAKFEFPKIRESGILTRFFQTNPNASQDEWEGLAKANT